ncbi:MAG: hypothetical protein M1477_01530, partial [Candidatus Thermoplasmatota archaeon]|nr:hypothetical protein [Candidatus Thermoplasmatota archaeon]
APIDPAPITPILLIMLCSSQQFIKRILYLNNFCNRECVDSRSCIKQEFTGRGKYEILTVNFKG